MPACVTFASIEPRVGGVLLEPVAQLLVGDLLDERSHLGVAELGLRLPLELRVAELHADDRGEAFPDVFSEEVLVLLLEEALRAAVLVDRVREGLLEALLVHPALGGGDVVRERVQALVVAGVPLHREVDFAGLGRLVERDDILGDRLLRRVQVAHEVGDAAVVLEDHVELWFHAFVAERDLEPAVQERHLAKPLEQRLRAELGLFEDRGVGPERDLGAGSFGVTDPLERALRLAAVLERDLVPTAVAEDRQVEPRRERVDDRDTHAVQAAGDLVTVATELAAGVERGEHDFSRRLVGVFGVQVDGNAAAVVFDNCNHRRRGA